MPHKGRMVPELILLQMAIYAKQLSDKQNKIIMSNYSLRARNKKTNEVHDFHAMDNYYGSHKYGYQINNPTFEFNELEYVYTQEQFSDLFEVVGEEDLLRKHRIVIDESTIVPDEFWSKSTEGWEENTFKLDDDLSSQSIIFHLPEAVEMLKISRDGFFYKGEKVEDVNKIYERFTEWMNGINKTAIQQELDRVAEEIEGMTYTSNVKNEILKIIKRKK